jgi:hypothetical protein
MLRRDKPQIDADEGTASGCQKYEVITMSCFRMAGPGFVLINFYSRSFVSIRGNFPIFSVFSVPLW